MRTIIAGSRTINDPNEVDLAIRNCGWQITEVVSGTAHGPDYWGEVYARYHNLPLKQFVPVWRPGGVYDPTAGFKRNEEMAVYGEALIAIWDKKSKGTKDMIARAGKHHLRIYIHYVT